MPSGLIDHRNRLIIGAVLLANGCDFLKTSADSVPISDNPGPIRSLLNTARGHRPALGLTLRNPSHTAMHLRACIKSVALTQFGRAKLLLNPGSGTVRGSAGASPSLLKHALSKTAVARVAALQTLRYNTSPAEHRFSPPSHPETSMESR